MTAAAAGEEATDEEDVKIEDCGATTRMGEHLPTDLAIDLRRSEEEVLDNILRG